MNVVFRLDASEKIGMGHLSRCNSLASSLVDKGAKIHFITRYLDKKFKKFLENKKYRLSYLPKNKVFEKSNNLNSENLWPNELQKIDAIQTKKLISNKKTDWLVVDHYGLNLQWEKILNQKVKKIMVIGDHLNRPHVCNLFLNQNFVKEKDFKLKRTLPKKCKVLLGPRYSLLDKSYLSLRKKMKIKDKKIKKVLISFGGSDMPKLLYKVVETFNCRELKNVNLMVVTNNKFHIYKKIKKKFFKSAKTLSKLIYKSDFCIGAGGSTTWERMCLGLPTLIFPIAKNQKKSSENLYKEKLIYLVKNYKKIGKKALRKKIISIIKDKKNLYQKKINGLTIVDGLGSFRLSEILFPSRSRDLKIRRAKSQDLITYFNWVNEKEVIKSSFKNKPISIKEHTKWFKNQIKNKKSIMFVLEANKLPVGQIRFDIFNKQAFIDYSLDKIVRERKWGKKIINLGIKNLKLSKINVINAKVKKNNLKSMSIFNNLGFEEKNLNSKYIYSLSRKNFFKTYEKI